MNGTGNGGVSSVLKEHEKLIAFIVLLCMIFGLVIIASNFDRGAANDIVTQGKLRIIDSSIAGLLAIAGMAAQALFRIGAGDKLPVTVENKASDPIPVDQTALNQSKPEDKTGELPEDQRI